MPLPIAVPTLVGSDEDDFYNIDLDVSDDHREVDWMLGSMRARVRDGHVEWAPQLAWSGIAGHARDGEHWYFATHNGALLRADSFLGPMTRVAEAGAFLQHGYTSRGRVLAIATNGDFYAGGSGDRFSLIRPPSAGRWVDIGFFDADHGVGVTEPGDVFRTDDGGLTFQSVAGIDGAAYRVAFEDVGGRIDTTRASLRIDAQHAIVPFGPGTPTDVHDTRPEVRDSFGAVFRDWLSTQPMMRARLLASNDAVELRDGTLLTVRGDRLISVHNGEIAQSSVGGISIRIVDDSHCLIASHGADFAAICRERGSSAVRRWDRRRNHWFDSARMTPARECSPGHGGANLIYCTGRCGSESRVSDDAFCWSDGGEWHTRLGPRPEGRFLVSGHTVIFFDTDAEDSPVSHYRLDDNGAPEPLRTAPADAVIFDVGAIDQTHVSIAATVNGRRSVAVGTPDSLFELHPLPDGVFGVRFADETHGVAFGRTLEYVWSTDDGGITWTRLALPVDGDVVTTELFQGNDAEVTCTPHGCALAGLVFWGPLAAATPALDAQHAAPGNARSPLPSFHVLGANVRCELQGAPRPLASAPVGPPDLAVRSYSEDGWVDLTDASLPASGGLDGRVVWYGVDARGPFEATARATHFPLVTDLAVDHYGAVQLAPLLTTRTRFIGQRCADFNDIGSTCTQLVIARANAAPRVIPFESFFHTVSRNQLRLRGRAALAMRDGSVVVQVALETKVESLADVILRIDAHDRIEVVRAYGWDVSRPQRVLARLGDRIGLAVFRRDDERHFEFHPATGDRTVIGRGWPTHDAMPACTASDDGRAAGSMELASDGLGTWGSIRIGAATEGLRAGIRSERVVVRADDSMCLRALTWGALHWVEGATERHEPLHLAVSLARDGRLSGHAIADNVLRDATCTVEH